MLATALLNPIRASLAVILAATGFAAYAQRGQAPLTVASPNGAIAVTVTADSDLKWAVSMNNSPVLLPSKIGMTFGLNQTIGHNPRIRTSRTTTVDQTLRPVLKIK